MGERAPGGAPPGSPPGGRDRTGIHGRAGAAARSWVALSFLVFCLPGLLPEGREVGLLGPAALDPEAIASLRADLDLDRPLPLRYVVWLGEVARGDLGRSYVRPLDVGEEIGRHLPLTVGLAAGVVAGVRRLGRRRAAAAAWAVRDLGWVVLGVLAAEALLDWPGLGRVTAEAAARRDFMVLQGVLLAVVTLGVLVAWLAPAAAVARPRPRPPRPAAGWAAWGWLVLFPAVAAFAPRLPLAHPERIAVASADRPPGPGHWLGTDSLGRDLLARTVFAARETLLLGAAATLVAVAGALVVAATARPDRRPSRPSRVFLARLGLPATTVVLALVAFEDRPLRRMSLWLAPVAFGAVLGWFRAAGGPARDAGHGAAEEARGLLIGLAGATLGCLAAVLAVEAAVGALGLGADDALTFGTLLAAGRVSFPGVPWPVAVPVAALGLTVAALRAAARHCAVMARVGEPGLAPGTMAG